MAPWDRKVREVVMYAYFDGYKHEEIVKITGLGASTVRKYLTRFKPSGNFDLGRINI